MEVYAVREDGLVPIGKAEPAAGSVVEVDGEVYVSGPWRRLVGLPAGC